MNDSKNVLLNQNIETEEWEDMNVTEEIEYEIENLQNKIAELEKKKQIKKEKIKTSSFEYNFQIMNNIVTKNTKCHRKLKLEFLERQRKIDRQRGKIIRSFEDNPKENDYEIINKSLQHNTPVDNYLFTEALFNMLKSFNERLEKLENI